jgi:hypothetical protein
LTLVRRSWSIKICDRWNSGILMLQAPVIGLLIGVAFGRRARKEMVAADWHDVAAAGASVVFLLVLSAIWFGCSNAAREIVGEWAVYRRERMVSLGIVPYVASKYVVLGGLCAGQCAVLLVVAYLTCGLRCPWYQSYPLLLLAALNGVGIGLTISAFARSSEMAIACLPLIIIPMVILCGILQPLKDLNAAARAAAQWTPSRWGFETLLLVESRYRPKWTPPLPAVVSESRLSLPPDHLSDTHPEDLTSSGDRRDFAEAFFPVKSYRTGIFVGIPVLVGMACGLAALVGLVLYSRDLK